jgi:phage-related protein
MSKNIIKDYLVALGFKDNMTRPMQRTLNRGTSTISRFSKSFVKAGTLIGTVFLAANIGVVKFVGNLSKADDEINEFAKSIGKSREEARKIKTALDAMGKSMDEIAESPVLMRTFERLQRDADKLQPPDFSEGLNQVREIGVEFNRLRQAGTYSVQWVGHYLVKYLQQPMEKFKETFGSLNDGIIKNIPKWADKAAKFMAGIVRLGMTLIRGTGAVFRAIKKIFDMIPKEIKIASGALAAFALFIRAGPLGRLIMIFTGLMLLAEDFFTYIDGGDALLGNFWQWLIDIWAVLNKQGGVIEKLRESFEKAMGAAVRGIRWVIGWLAGLRQRLRDNDAIENWGDAFSRVGRAVGAVFETVTDILRTLFSGFTDGEETVQPFLAWLIGEALPGAIGLIADIVRVVAEAIGWFIQLPYVRELILGVALALGIWKTAQLLLNAVTALAAGKIGLIIMGITALITIVYLLIKNWDKVADFFKELWERIKSVFANIGQWFSDRFNEAWQAIKNAFSAVGSFFKGIWDSIVGMFKKVGTVVGDAVGGAFKSVVNAVIGFVQRIINGFFGTINRAINLINKIPGVNIPLIGEVELPKLAKGGVLRKGQVGLLEGDGAEAVVPLEKNTEWIRKVADMFAKNLLPKMSRGAEMLHGLNNGLNKSAESVTNSTVNNTVNHNSIDMSSSYTINDTSGRPEATANAVDRKEQVKIRNLKSILNT